MTTRVDVVVIGGGHNGLVCACYLARAGLAVTVLEASETAGGCIHTVDLPDGRGRFELGAHEHGGIRGSGVAADLELEARFGLRFHLRARRSRSRPATAAPRWRSTTRSTRRSRAWPPSSAAARPRRIAASPAGPLPASRCSGRSTPAHLHPCRWWPDCRGRGRG